VLSRCSFEGVKARGVDPAEPSITEPPAAELLTVIGSGMDVVDNEEGGNEELREGGSQSDSGVSRTSEAYFSPSVWISSKRRLCSKGCLRRNFANLIDLGILAMICGSMAIATFISSSVYPRPFSLQQVLA
jgi:hypothetical protein